MVCLFTEPADDVWGNHHPSDKDLLILLTPECDACVSASSLVTLIALTLPRELCSPAFHRRSWWWCHPACFLYTCRNPQSWCDPRSPASRYPASDPCRRKNTTSISPVRLKSHNKAESECEQMSLYLKQNKKKTRPAMTEGELCVMWLSPGHVYDRIQTLPVDYSLLMEEEEADGDLSGVESGQTRWET